VRIPDDEQFEAYLKRFEPIAPDAVPSVSLNRSTRRSLSLRIWLATAAAMVVMGVAVLYVRDNRAAGPNRSSDAALRQRMGPYEPLTVRSANAWLAAAPSFKTAVDELAFRSQTNPLRQGEQSAVAVLCKEKARL
jgi:glucan phosphoethanolaminetransferase (alkaline phosphatase superfamily)